MPRIAPSPRARLGSPQIKTLSLHDHHYLYLGPDGVPVRHRPFYQPVAEVFVVDMLLAKPLAAGETATLEYSAGFHYPTPPAPEFRRIVQYSVENLDIRVEFHPDRLPGNVVWAVWDGMDGPIVERQPVVLDSQFAVHRYLRLASETVAGFHWDW